MNNQKNYFFIMLMLFATSAPMTGCDDDEDEDEAEGEGDLSVEVWGEDFVEQGIPADELADAYSITFDKFLINLGEIKAAADETSEAPLGEAVYKIWDLAKPGPLAITGGVVPAGSYHNTTYAINKATASSGAGNALAEDVQMMIDQGLSVYVQGSATKDTAVTTFKWGFETNKTYGHCESLAEITDGGQASIQITIHGDHLFYDSATSTDPELRFGDIALADQDKNGDVTPAELAAYNITPLANYNVGNLEIDNLWDYIAHMTTTLGHIDGEGHCQ